MQPTINERVNICINRLQLQDLYPFLATIQSFLLTCQDPEVVTKNIIHMYVYKFKLEYLTPDFLNNHKTLLESGFLFTSSSNVDENTLSSMQEPMREFYDANSAHEWSADVICAINYLILSLNKTDFHEVVSLIYASGKNTNNNVSTFYNSTPEQVAASLILLKLVGYKEKFSKYNSTKHSGLSDKMLYVLANPDDDSALCAVEAYAANLKTQSSKKLELGSYNRFIESWLNVIRLNELLKSSTSYVNYLDEKLLKATFSQIPSCSTSELHKKILALKGGLLDSVNAAINQEDYSITNRMQQLVLNKIKGLKKSISIDWQEIVNTTPLADFTFSNIIDKVIAQSLVNLDPRLALECLALSTLSDRDKRVLLDILYRSNKIINADIDTLVAQLTSTTIDNANALLNYFMAKTNNYPPIPLVQMHTLASWFCDNRSNISNANSATIIRLITKSMKAKILSTSSYDKENDLIRGAWKKHRHELIGTEAEVTYRKVKAQRMQPDFSIEHIAGMLNTFITNNQSSPFTEELNNVFGKCMQAIAPSFTNNDKGSSDYKNPEL